MFRFSRASANVEAPGRMVRKRARRTMGVLPNRYYDFGELSKILLVVLHVNHVAT